jgi:hypothetical protein
MDLYPDYNYKAGDEALPQPGTTDNGWDWNGFIDSISSGVTSVVTAVQGGESPFTSPGPMPRTATVQPAGRDNTLLLLLIGAVLVYALMK